MAAPHQINGELVAWSGDRSSFDLLQQRLAAGAARARALAAEHPPLTWCSTFSPPTVLTSRPPL